MYSNIMVSLAGNIGGKVSGLVGGWDELVTRNIFAPIGMNGTYSNARIVPADADYSKGFHFVDGKLKAYAVNDTFATDSCHPAGAIVSNVEDLAKWVGVINRQGVLANGSSLVTQKQFKQLTKPRIFVDTVSVGEDFKSYGLGWQLASYRGKVNVGHGGSTAGYMAEIDTFPNDDLAIIVLSNMDASYVPKLISRWITDQILFPSVQFDWSKHYQNVTLKQAMANEKDAADMLRDRIPNSVPSLPFTMYEGQFDSPTFGSITLKLYDFENHYYRMEWRGEKGGRVKMSGVMGHWELDTFGLYEFTVAEYKNYTVPTLPVMFSQDGKQFEIPMSEFTVGTFIRN
ncbi:hypothetical protein HDU99_001007 [Rhizoclosmatium hyalinum]|nr:hypothetical protein HDU99_001007 [Rhizoclosmatium hyalinum]